MDQPQVLRFESPQTAAERERAWLHFARPGAEVPLITDDGVATLVIESVADDGSVTVRLFRPDES